MGETGQHKHKIAFGPTRQLSDELERQVDRSHLMNPRNFCEVGEFHRSHVQVDNPVNVTCGSLNTVKTVTP